MSFMSSQSHSDTAILELTTFNQNKQHYIRKRQFSQIEGTINRRRHVTTHVSCHDMIKEKQIRKEYFQVLIVSNITKFSKMEYEYLYEDNGRMLFSLKSSFIAENIK